VIHVLHVIDLHSGDNLQQVRGHFGDVVSAVLVWTATRSMSQASVLPRLSCSRLRGPRRDGEGSRCSLLLEYTSLDFIYPMLLLLPVAWKAVQAIY
jgi:hypothetical protein